MKTPTLLCVALLALNLHAADTNALLLAKTISLPDVRGRIDHLAIDLKRQRLFMAALGNNTVEVMELAEGKRIHTISGCSKPQGLAFLPKENRLVIANGASGELKILDAQSFATVTTIGKMPDVDNVRYDAKTGLVYAGYGSGALGIISASDGKKVGDIKLAGHPESFQLEQQGNRIFVNVPDAGQIAVVDRVKHAIITNWFMGEFHANFPMALNETNHRLFVGCRRPASMIVLDTATGKSVANVEISGDTDDLFYDASRKQIYVSCGEGFVDVIAQTSPDSYERRARIATVAGARTSFFSADRGEFYLAVRETTVPALAELRVYTLH